MSGGSLYYCEILPPSSAHTPDVSIEELRSRDGDVFFSVSPQPDALSECVPFFFTIISSPLLCCVAASPRGRAGGNSGCVVASRQTDAGGQVGMGLRPPDTTGARDGLPREYIDRAPVNSTACPRRPSPAPRPTKAALSPARRPPPAPLCRYLPRAAAAATPARLFN